MPAPAQVQFKALKSFKWPTDRPLLLNQFFQVSVDDIINVRAEVIDSPGFCALIRNGCIEVLDAPEGTNCAGIGPGVEVLTREDKDLVSFGTDDFTPYQTTGITITDTPVGDGDVEVRVNGVAYPVCDGDRTQAKPFYFSNNGGLSARFIGDIEAGDTLYVNGVHLGFALGALDLLDLCYLIQASASPNTDSLTRVDKNLVPSLTDNLSNEQDTGLTISQTPQEDGNVEVYINGIYYTLGDGVKTGDLYFTGDGNLTARLIADIVAGDQLYINGFNIGFGLDPLLDTLDFRYVMGT